ncbi:MULTISPECIES: beta-glucosidase [Micrococcaceae]|uniref:beta-glucosidase family protein n=1 Tax=Micrococcaceae TaxID=1268 RepID=UPI00161587EE|nr:MULTISPECIES: glycoside hydrolase family 3 C-terminal domain-containing protein [Micrococcaceae]MBB5748943.1 beta-glucosidase [Micrococcus sp. TA1]HRO29190.1 glycoside hydrolase family 3 C-terminal domain-containing protein [Citricoccus sp.]HRO92856.1 glycoside hydrolase family 3 C-terminal domain-containing protein [Citricoccus sp.]
MTVKTSTARRTILGATALVSAAVLTTGGGLAAPPAITDRPWLDPRRTAQDRTEALLDAMTLDQKIQQIAVSRFNENDTGDPVVINRSGNNAYQNGVFPPQGTLPGCEWQDTGRQIRGIDELGIPTVRMTNGGTGVKGGSCGNDPQATGLPSTLALAATFDRGLNLEAGRILGEETKAFAHQVMLGPGMNLVRHPYGGRNYEYFSEDPYLTGSLATEQVRGIQGEGVQAQVKHLAGNEQETERWTMGVQVPAQAMNELYMMPFEMTVQDADPASVMCSFPDVNGTYACDSPELLQDALRDDWDFDGWVMSDRRAIHDTAAAVTAGTGVELDWAPQYYTPARVKAAIDAGAVTEADIDELLRPRYVEMIGYGHMDEPYDRFRPEIVDLDANGASARRMAESGAVLLKNEDGFLPLDGETTSIALIGVEWFAGEAKLSPRSVRDNNENVETAYTVTPQEGLENVITDLGHDTRVTYDDGRDPQAAAELAAASDVVLLMIGDNPHETVDRQTLGFPPIDLDPSRDGEDWVEQEPLIEAVLDANAENTAVVLKTSGTVIMPWLDDVPAVLEAWFPGMEDGNAVAGLLYGEVNPSGKLPMTFGTTEREAAFATREQYPGTRQDTGKPGGPGPYGDGSDQLIARYTEGLEMGYRWYEAHDEEPVFAFGHGLSYTSFAYDGLRVGPVNGNGGLDVSFTVTNTGEVTGAEAAQVYLTLPDEAGQPAKRLVGFEKVTLRPGERTQVSVRIGVADSNHPFSYFAPTDPEFLENWADGAWTTPDGRYRVHVGGSSADTPLEQGVTLRFPDPAAGGGGA